MPRLAEELADAAEEVLDELEAGSDDDFDEEEEATLLDELALLDVADEEEEDDATLLDELVGEAETLAGDDVLEALDVDCEPTGPVPVETI